MSQAAQKLIAAVESMLGDVEGMKANVAGKTDSFDEGYGPFSEFVRDGYDEVYVEWPNLTISSKDVKTALEAFKKEQAKPEEWSGHPDPAMPDKYWIDDKTGERVNAETGERTPQ